MPHSRGPRWASPWLGSMPALERAIDAPTFDFCPGGECHQGVYLCAEMLEGAQRTRFPGETLREQRGEVGDGGSQAVYVGAVPRHCLIGNLLFALLLKEALHLRETQPSLPEDMSLHYEEQTQHKALALSPNRGQVLRFGSCAPTPSPTEPYNFQAAHPSHRPQSAWLPPRRVPSETVWVSVGWAGGVLGHRSAQGSLLPQLSQHNTCHAPAPLGGSWSRGCTLCSVHAVCRRSARQPTVQANSWPNIPCNGLFCRENMKYLSAGHGLFFFFLDILL